MRSGSSWPTSSPNSKQRKSNLILSTSPRSSPSRYVFFLAITTRLTNVSARPYISIFKKNLFIVSTFRLNMGINQWIWVTSLHPRKLKIFQRSTTSTKEDFSTLWSWPVSIQFYSQTQTLSFFPYRSGQNFKLHTIYSGKSEQRSIVEATKRYYRRSLDCRWAHFHRVRNLFAFLAMSRSIILLPQKERSFKLL